MSVPPPTVQVSARHTFNADPAHILELLAAPPATDESPHIQRIEALQPGVRYRIYFPAGNPPVDIELLRGRSAEGHPQVGRRIHGAIGQTILQWTLRSEPGATVVEAHCTQMVENPVLHDRLDLVKSELDRRLDDGIRRLTERLRSRAQKAIPVIAAPEPRVLPAYALRPGRPAPSAPAKPGSRYGGQPNWRAAPQWPVVKGSGRAMTFVMQLELPPPLRFGGHQTAYVFIDASADRLDRHTRPEAGRNAVILQGGPRFTPIVPVLPLERGPTLHPRFNATDTPDRSAGRRGVEGDIAVVPAAAGDRFPAAALLGGSILTDLASPSGGGWRAIVQMHSHHLPCWAPFSGELAIFVNEDGTGARLALAPAAARGVTADHGLTADDESSR